MEQFLTGNRAKKFESIQHCLVPLSQRFYEVQSQESLRLVNEFLATKSRIICFQIKLFFILIDLISLVKYLRPFDYLNKKRQTKICYLLFDSPLPILRKGFWGINTLAKMSVYSQPSIFNEIQYQLKEIKDD